MAAARPVWTRPRTVCTCALWSTWGVAACAAPRPAATPAAAEVLAVDVVGRVAAAADYERYVEALQHAVVARQMFNYYAALARNAGHSALLGIRDAMMADNLRYIAERERDRGKLLVFAHNSHVQRGRFIAGEGWCQALRMEPFSWWPAGSHLARALGPRYAVIGTAVGVSDPNGIAAPEAGSLEARLVALPGPARFVPTHEVRRLPSAAIPARTASATNLSYVPFNAQSVTDFDAWAVFDTMTYNRGAPPLPTR
jgi:erythromycin esterase-like protein